MHWSLIFGLMFFTTAFCNIDSGPAQVIAIYLLRKYEEESEVTSHRIAPNCPSPCGFKEFVQHVSPKTGEVPKYEIADWGKLSDTGLLNKEEAITELRRIEYGGNIRSTIAFINLAAGSNFDKLLSNLETTIQNAKSTRIKNGKTSVSEVYDLMLDYWEISSDWRRKNLADHIVKGFPDAFAKRFPGKTVAVIPTDPIFRPFVDPYVQIDLLATLRAAQSKYGLGDRDLDTFILTYADNYNKTPQGIKHLGVYEMIDGFVICNRM
ncbi:hypothetical protein NQ176_g324 [Zarea fungicola]|uniref:Uncharacterized protein n=1 Tax=Zarea fungicola TaxID=93591 RepID=A0ACC1P067_9HYPO|nr:hypothetical protein NQ176_g324 [Lecanicillium fungicola]